MSEIKKLIFYSGGRHHFQGFGEWIFSLQANGKLQIEHYVANDKKFDKTFSLSSAETRYFWAIIERLEPLKLKGSNRSGVPDEAEYRFIFENESNHHEVNIWANDVGNRLEMKELVDSIKECLKKYSKRTVVI